MKKPSIAPDKSLPIPWEGSVVKKPWEYRVTAVIPCINGIETLPLVIETLRLQTERPYIVIVDTGSEDTESVENLRDEDVEVHFIRSNSWRHPSEPVSAAMDLSLSFVHTRFLFCTHSDCFLKRKELLAEMVELCEVHKAVGYQLSPRPHPDWEWMLGHTCTMFDVMTLDKIDATWGLRRLCNNRGVELKPAVCGPNWPDTELLINYQLKQNGINSLLIGSEQNYERTNDNNIDHCRSLPSSMIYFEQYAQNAKLWMNDAIEQAKKRIEEWSKK
jgi:glycosyltransferase involved in cell wall biosynthesis